LTLIQPLLPSPFDMAASKNQTDISEGRRREIGRRLFEAREDLALTQAQLANRVGCFHSTISRYETGERIPNERLLRRLAEVLDKPIPYLRASDYTNGRNPEGRDDAGESSDRQ